MNLPGNAFSFLSGGGEMGALIRSHDWASTPLGEASRWPQSLKTAVGILLSSGYPMYIAWGREFTQLYNDAYRPILGSTKHPRALGISTTETFREIWDFIGPMFRDVMETGRASTYIDQLLLLERHGFREECYFTFSYSAIPSDEGVGGVLVTVLETTDRVIQERRVRVLRDLLENRSRHDLDAIAQGSIRAIAADREDIPFALLLRPDELGRFALCGQCGIDAECASDVLEKLGDCIERSTIGSCAAEELGFAVPIPDFDPVSRVACIGIGAPGRGRPELVIVAGLSARLEYAGKYEEFLQAAAANIGVVIAEAEALEHEKRRAQELAEIDRAKTVFFSDVSHEFRTPITLMMGPLEEAIAATDGEVRENLLIARRNTARLQKLVNSLLDFSRIEAGRMQARIENVDLARLTVELASNFRSAIERAGLRLEVDCPPLSRPAQVDASMWEKIVLNLLSNAFKHTFTGSIRVTLREEGRNACLEIRDSGIGIPAEQLPHIFERFRRVPNAKSRTHEGSGIGLALVRELARMHGGDVGVRSREGEGSTFSVTVPMESALQAAPPLKDAASAAPSVAAAAYVEEALRWLPGEVEAEARVEEARLPTEAKVLIADDNADMREYLQRLVSQRWTVKTCADGAAALQLARSWRPDLLISDVMMPRLDGFELIQHMRSDEVTATIPVVLLSARAGEDARIDGLRAGADDYLVKPFTARDLFARIEHQLARSRVRREQYETTQRLSRLFEQAPIGIALLRCPEFTYTIANEPYRELVARPELIGKTVKEALPELEGQGIYEALEQARTTQTPFIGESVHLKLNRRGVADEGWFTYVFQPIVDPDGRTEAILVVVYEVTELVRAKQAAEEASFAKDEFLAMLGHELRNPLAPILTALQIMRMRGDVGGKERAIVERQVSHLMSLVDDLLDVSRVTRGKLELDHHHIELAHVVSEAIEQAGPMIEQRSHVVQVDVPATGLPVHADEKRLSQVVTNLLTNAAKFTPSGGTIRVSARVEGNEAVLRVADSGVGMDAAMLPKVFDIFYQGRKTFDRQHGGLGLGLAIVRNLVALHGGTVSARSEGPGRGSEFEVRLPLDLQGATPSAPPVESLKRSGSGRRILVVDDNRDAAETLAALLDMKGHTVRAAFDAPSALAMATELLPEAAFLDLGLPGTSGYELAQSLWAVPGLAHLPVFALSGYGQAEDRRRSGDAGFTGHLVKPVSFDQVEAALREAFDAPAERA